MKKTNIKDEESEVSLSRVFKSAVRGYRMGASSGNPAMETARVAGGESGAPRNIMTDRPAGIANANVVIPAFASEGVQKIEIVHKEPGEMKGIEIIAPEGRRRKKTEEGNEQKISLTYPLIPSRPAPGQEVFASASIKWSPAESALVYIVSEPELSEAEKNLLEQIKASLIEKLDVDFTKLRRGEAREYLMRRFDETVSLMAGGLAPEKRKYLLYYIERDFIGLGRIEPLMHDPNIEDISCDGVKIPIFIYHRNGRIGTIRTNISYETPDELDSFLNKLAQRSGKTVSVAEPLLDSSLPDGSRIQLTLGTDIAKRGSNFCIKEGHVQMHDGSIEDIKELFESWKQIYGSAFDEYGNEICVPERVYASGADEKNLRQEKGKVLQILKMPPPEKLVRVSLEECGKASSSLEVTENHMFHVLTETGIKMIEASRLKSGLWVPVPAKIEAEGSSEKEFADMILDKFLNFGSSEIYVKIDEKLKPQITFSASNSRLKDIKRGKITSIPLPEFIKNLQMGGRNIRELESITCIIREGKKGRGSAVRMPFVLTESLAYFVGWVIGDGSLTKDNVSIHAGLNENHKNALLKVINELFGVDGKTYKNDANRIYINSGIVSKILHDIFGIPYGYKSRKVDVPKIIQKSSNKIISGFLEGLFEADGSFENAINLTTYSKNLAAKVIFLLARFGVYSSFNKDGNAIRVYVPSAYYGRFSQNVFSNDKIVKLARRQKKTKKSNMLPAFFSDIVWGLCKKYGVKSNEISRILNPSEIRKGGRVSFRKIREFNELLKRKCNQEGMPPDGVTETIDRLIRGDLEFKKISNVEIMDNNDKSPVYDISCNPVSFYIGGKDSPLFVHDTIRKFTDIPLSPIDMMKFGTLDSKILSYLWMLTEYNKSTLIGGGTATGKTSLLNALSLFIKPELKIVTIEDTSELRLPHSHWVPQVARQPMAEVEGRKMGEVDMFDLLRESLRQRPDFIIVGEVRGKEAYVLFQQIATGHAGMATIHADTIEKLVDRLTTPPIELSPSLLENLDVIIFLVRIKSGNKYVRRVSSVFEVVGFDRERNAPITNLVFRWDPVGDRFETVNPSIVLKKISDASGIRERMIQSDIGKRIKVLDWLMERNYSDYRIFAKVMKLFYTEQDRLFGMMEGGK